MRNQHLNTGAVAYDQVKPESLHVVTNGGSSYCKVYLNRVEVDQGDFDDVMQRILERLGVSFVYDRDDMSLPVIDGTGRPMYPAYDTTLDPISPDFDPSHFGLKATDRGHGEETAVNTWEAGFLGGGA